MQLASEEKVVIDGNITTSRGLGTAVDFSLSLISQLLGAENGRKNRRIRCIQKIKILFFAKTEGKQQKNTGVFV